MRVAILLPVYNEEKLIAACLSSIQKQTHKNFVCFILDDGSSDNTYNSIKNFLVDHRFVYKKFKHEGLVKTLNKGLMLCKGFDFIARMDADDIMFIDRLKIQSDYLKKHSKIDIVASTISYQDIQLKPSYDNKLAYNSKDVYASLTGGNVINHPTVMFRSSLLPKLHYSDVNLGEDLALWYDIVTPNNTVVLEKPLVIYNNKKRQFMSFNDKLKLKNSWSEKKSKKVVLSIVDRLNPNPLGIEKTISYRTKYLGYLNALPYTIIREPVVLPDLRWYYSQHMRFREDTTIVVPNLTSDIGMDWCSYYIENYFKDNNVLSVEYIDKNKIKVYLIDGFDILNIRNGVIVQSLFTKYNNSKPTLYKLYSSGLYLIKNYETDELTYLNKDGSIALIKKRDNTWWRNDRETSLSEILLTFIETFNNHDVIIIKDYFNNDYPLLRDYAREKKIPYIGYIHYSPLDTKGEVVDTVKNADFDLIISSSKPMIKDIKTIKKIPIIYIPPIFTRVYKKNNNLKDKRRFLMLTSSFSGKRVKEITNWFEEIDEDIVLDVYGLTKPNNTEYKKVFFKGFVHTDFIKWDDYIGYISNSESEAFSVALHEAIAHGLKPIVFDSNYAHRQWCMERYNNKKEFYELIKNTTFIKPKVLVNFIQFIKYYKKLLNYRLK